MRHNFEKFERYLESFWMKPGLQKIWCVYGECPRTTNIVEGWYQGINKEVPKNETNILIALKIIFRLHQSYPKWTNPCTKIPYV